ncbi:hypothetical protein UFOVP253_21 [uncultured Caudovirales phage]|uniref:Uncharacterized protein n=1 Tax=uncultured Caudovirales phage TaxID=2100421 RepID=A0A6J5LE39_9CAUD|nr:hypothetical protein UFOVP253_21 [uncultured Caudovirales phage]
MNDKDPLAAFDFDQVSKPGLFLKFQAGKSITMRVLTTDPVLQEQEFKDKVTGEINLNLKFNFIVYNITEGKAQIWGASPSMARKIGEFHNDNDFGANIKKVDFKITPTGEGKERRYELQVLRHSGNETQLTAAQIKEAQTIDLDSVIEGGSRMSLWKPKTDKPEDQKEDTATDAYKKAAVDVVYPDSTPDEEVDLSSIPF